MGACVAHSDEAPGSTDELRLPVDAEHGGIRLAGCGVFLLGIVITTGLVVLLVPNGTILGLIAGIVVAAIIAQPAEKQLKARWPSGRELTLSSRHIRLEKHSQPQIQIDAQRPVQVLMWQFRIRRRARVPKGWYVVACAIEQDELYLPIYTLMAPDVFAQMPMSDHFIQLRREESQETSGTGLSGVRIAGEQRRLMAAERERGLDGAEMTPEAFQQFLHYLKTHYAAWMPQP